MASLRWLLESCRKDGKTRRHSEDFSEKTGNLEVALYLAALLAGLIILFAAAGVGSSLVIGNETARLPANLDPLIRTCPAALEKALKALKRGVENCLNGQYTAGLEALPDDASAKDTALQDYILHYRAKANLMLERGDEALKNYRLVQARYPDSSLYQDAVIGECLAELKLRNPSAALATLRNPKLEENADTLYYQGRALEESGEQKKAMDVYLRVYCNYVNSKTASLAQERLLALSPRALAGTQNYKSLLTRADSLLGAGLNREAQALLLRLGKVPGPDRLSSERRSLLYADAEYRLGKAAPILPYVRKVTSADPALHARAIYLEAACYRRLNREDSFLKMRDRGLELYPKSPYSEQLLLAAAAHFDVSNEIEKAQEAYRELYERFPNGEYAERALWRLSLCSYVRKRHDEALQGFYKYLRAYPDPRNAIAAIYWIGRCYQSLGDTIHASYLLGRVLMLANHSYYGKCALEAEQTLKSSGSGGSRAYAGLNFDEVAKTVDGIGLSLAMVAEPSGAAASIVERARQLATADLPDLALSELRWGIRRLPVDKALSYVMARIYEIKGDYYGVITTLRRAFPDCNDRPTNSLPEQIWELLFPVKHWNLISKQAVKNNVDPNLVLGIIRQESAFREEARSPADARGLMQVLPSTGRKVARQAGVTRYAVKRLYGAETNIVLGTHYLASLLRHYDGNEELALAAYDAGDTRVDRWMREFGTADMAEFVERIPFNETRSYIKQVLTNKAHYRFLTAPQPGRTIDN
jgi:soluble lytic murein transglycosylase